MTLDQLRMLVKISETGSVLAAAQALNRTQPTVSVAIRKLEDELGVSLLSRDSYRANLTPAGKMLYRKAQVVLQQSDSFRTLAHHLATGNEPEIRIAVEASCPMPLLLKIMRDSERSFPLTDFSLSVENLWGALERLEDGVADLAICPWLQEDLSVESFPFVQSHLLTVAVPDYAPLRGKRELDLSDLQNAVQVVVKDSSHRPRKERYGVNQQGRHWLVNDHFTKKELLLAGMGWGRLHQHLIERELREGVLVPLNIRNYQNQLDIEMRVVRRQGVVHGPVAEAMWGKFKMFAEM
ncbi:MAG: LysR family transcriptional regulator [Desulfuromonadales bacterium]|nr:LysR family transcriptional regulator [Desulfuromonadales bacterium]